MQLCSYQDEAAKLFKQLRQDPIASDENLGTAKNLTNEELAELVCAAFSCRNAKTNFNLEANWRDLVKGWFVIACYAGKAIVLSCSTYPNNAFIDTLVELANVYADKHS